MDKKICVRCDKEYSGSGFMWDFQKNGKQYCCEIVCQDCDKEMNPSRYKEDDKDKQIAELQETITKCETLREEENEAWRKENETLKDKLHRRNLQIADLKKDKKQGIKEGLEFALRLIKYANNNKDCDCIATLESHINNLTVNQ